MRFSTLDAICKALNCQPGDILEYRGRRGLSLAGIWELAPPALLFALGCVALWALLRRAILRGETQGASRGAFMP